MRPISKFLLSSLENHLLSNLVYCSIKNHGMPQKGPNVMLPGRALQNLVELWCKEKP